MARGTATRSKDASARDRAGMQRQKAAREKVAPPTKKGKADLERVRMDVGRSCEVCGNVYDKAFEVRLPDAMNGGETHVFDSFECAIHALAPTCTHCGCRIMGHGMEADGEQYCCANCARASGHDELADRAG